MGRVRSADVSGLVIGGGVLLGTGIGLLRAAFMFIRISPRM